MLACLVQVQTIPRSTGTIPCRGGQKTYCPLVIKSWVVVDLRSTRVVVLITSTVIGLLVGPDPVYVGQLLVKLSNVFIKVNSEAVGLSKLTTKRCKVYE